MKANLTDKLVAQLEPPKSGRKRVWDTRQSGLCVAVTIGGSKSFYVASRLNSKLTWRRIGLCSAYSVAEARVKAREMLVAMHKGQDPKPEPVVQQPKVQTLTFAKLARRYCDEHVSGLRNWRKINSMVEELVREFGPRPAADISRGDVLVLLDRVRSRGVGAARNVVFGALAPMMNFAVERDLIPHSPCHGLRMTRLLGAKVSQDQVLTSHEVSAVWSSLHAVDANFATVVKLLLLTGCRRSEMADLRWPEINWEKRLITIPGERMKQAKAHEIPMSDSVVALLRAVPRRLHSDKVFPIFNFSIQKRRLDAVSGVSGTVIHDYRRTVRTQLAELGVADSVAEACLAHTQGGVAGTYNRHRYRAEKLDALTRWEQHLLGIVERRNGTFTGLTRT